LNWSIRDTTTKRDYPTNIVGMGVLPSPDKCSEVIENFGNLVEPLLQVQFETIVLTKWHVYP